MILLRAASSFDCSPETQIRLKQVTTSKYPLDAVQFEYLNRKINHKFIISFCISNSQNSKLHWATQVDQLMPLFSSLKTYLVKPSHKDPVLYHIYHKCKWLIHFHIKTHLLRCFSMPSEGIASGWVLCCWDHLKGSADFGMNSSLKWTDRFTPRCSNCVWMNV